MKKHIILTLIALLGLTCSAKSVITNAIVDQPFTASETVSFFTPHSSTTYVEVSNGAVRMHGSYAYMSTMNNKTFSSMEDVYIEYRADNVNQHVGFGKGGVAGGYEGIVNSNGTASIKKGSTTVQSSATTYTVGDIFRIEKKGQTIYYYKNGVEFYQEAYALGTSFYIGIASSTGSSNVEGITIGIIKEYIYSATMEEARINKLKVNTDILPDGYQVAVNGEMIIEGIMIKDFTSWPDYVFEEDYPLKDLKTLEKEIQQLGHLPNVPSAKKVLKEGVDLGDMEIILLEKIEELTLYTIQQQKLFEKQQEQINQLKGKVE